MLSATKSTAAANCLFKWLRIAAGAQLVAASLRLAVARRACFVWVVAVVAAQAIVWNWGNVCRGQERGTDKSAAEFYLNGLWNHLEGLRSCVCVVTSSRQETFKFVHDYSNDIFLFDFQVARDDYRGARRVLSARNHLNSFEYTSNGGVLIRRANSVRPVLLDATPWDLRLVAVGTFANKYVRTDLKSLKKESFDKFTFERIENIKSQDSEVVKLVYSETAKNGPSVIREYMVCPSRGFACMGATLSYAGDKGQMVDCERSEAVLDEIDDYWLPVACKHFRYGKLYESLSLDWQSVNEDIEAKAFEVPSMGLPVGTTVASQKLGSTDTVFEYKIGEANTVSEMGKVRESGRKARWFSLSNVVLFGSATVLTFGLASLVFRRKT